VIFSKLLALICLKSVANQEKTLSRKKIAEKLNVKKESQSSNLDGTDNLEKSPAADHIFYSSRANDVPSMSANYHPQWLSIYHPNPSIHPSIHLSIHLR
jgi:hypothetical protein